MAKSQKFVEAIKILWNDQSPILLKTTHLIDNDLLNDCLTSEFWHLEHGWKKSRQTDTTNFWDWTPYGKNSSFHSNFIFFNFFFFTQLKRIFDKLELQVYYTDYPRLRFNKEFDVHVQDFCAPSSLTITNQFLPVKLFYTVFETS